jgi:hypothetical protein
VVFRSRTTIVIRRKEKVGVWYRYRIDEYFPRWESGPEGRFRLEELVSVENK